MAMYSSKHTSLTDIGTLPMLRLIPYRWESNPEFSSRKGTCRDNTLNGVWKSKEGERYKELVSTNFNVF